MSQEKKVAVELQHITKRFGTFVANNDVSIKVHYGEVLGLLGENGAGKSTLMNILYGMLKPDEGKILINGEERNIRGPQDAMNLGIQMVHQHFMLAMQYSAWENVVLGNEPKKGPFLDIGKSKQAVIDAASLCGFKIDPSEIVEKMHFGTALIFFVAFLCIAFLRSGDLPSIAMLLAAAGAGGGMILRFKPYIANRFAVWGHVWENAQTTGYQQTRTMSAIAGGGLFGVGPEKSWLKTIGAANTDLVFGVVSEQFGLLLALSMIAVLLILALFTVRSSAQARSGFYSITSCSAIAMLVFQATLNVFGSLDLLPLTGVTFPFVSTGGSSMMSCWAILAYIKAADTRQNAGFTFKLPHGKKPKVTAPPPAEISVDFFREEDDFF